MNFWKHIASRFKENDKCEAGPDLAGIRDACDMQSASHALYEAMKQYPDHSVRSELVACFQSRLLEETDANGIYDAFEDMYRRYKRDGDSLAMNIARMLGEKAPDGAIRKGDKTKNI